MEIICHIKWKPLKNFKQLRYKMSFQLVFRSFLTFYKLIISCSCCSVAKSCLTLCDPKNCNIPGFPVLHYLLEFAQTHVHWISDATQPSHPHDAVYHILNSRDLKVFYQVILACVVLWLFCFLWFWPSREALRSLPFSKYLPCPSPLTRYLGGTWNHSSPHIKVVTKSG